VLPLYFKHSNFSSFARQLNFYGFRKLRTDPILTSDVDPCTSCYVRFYHERFQRGKPELLQHIKRATKTDQHSKDDVESLRNDISDLKDLLRSTMEDYDRKLAELSYECNRRITAMNAEYDNLAVLVHRVLGSVHQSSAVSAPSPLVAASSPPTLSRQTTPCRAADLLSNCSSLRHTLCSSMKTASFPTSTTTTAAPVNMTSSAPSLHSDLLHSLSQAAVSIQNTLLAQQQQQQNIVAPADCGKRSNCDPTENTSETTQRSSCRRKTDR
jgi:HSF-type DNA-binding